MVNVDMTMQMSEQDTLEVDAVKTTLDNLHEYLSGNLVFDNNVALKMYTWDPKLLNSTTYNSILRFYGNREYERGFSEWYWFARTSYTKVSLMEFCKCLRKAGEDARALLIEVAKRIERELQGPPAPSDSDSEVESLVPRDPVKEIISLYWDEKGKIPSPSCPQDIVCKYDNLLKALHMNLRVASNPTIIKIYSLLCLEYRRYHSGVRPGPLHPVPKNGSDLWLFIAEKSTPFETFLIQHTVDDLDHDGLKSSLACYNSMLATYVLGELKSYENSLRFPVNVHHVTKKHVLLAVMLFNKDHYLDKVFQNATESDKEDFENLLENMLQPFDMQSDAY